MIGSRKPNVMRIGKKSKEEGKKNNNTSLRATEEVQPQAEMIRKRLE
jgi:hypothetical protein